MGHSRPAGSQQAEWVTAGQPVHSRPGGSQEVTHLEGEGEQGDVVCPRGAAEPEMLLMGWLRPLWPSGAAPPGTVASLVGCAAHAREVGRSNQVRFHGDIAGHLCRKQVRMTDKSP